MVKNRLMLAALFVAAVMLVSEISYAQVGLAVMGARRAKKKLEEQQQAKAEQAKETQATAGVVDAGNKICPVMGIPVNGKDFYEYNGKRYGLCCSMCPATFAKDPAKYAAIADKEAK